MGHREQSPPFAQLNPAQFFCKICSDGFCHPYTDYNHQIVERVIREHYIA